jgi:tight adherence protein C
MSFISMQVVSAIILPSLLGLIGVIGAFPGLAGMLILLAAFVFGYFMPVMILESIAQRRDAEILYALPNALDILTVSVEAGLGFDMALTKVVEKTSGPLTDEFTVVLHEIRMGRSRSDALQRLSQRVKVEDLSIFISSLIQADKLGISLVKLLRIQSDEIRIKRRQRAEQFAQKAPLKMSVVLVLFVLPSLILILLGASIISVIETLGG